VASLRSRLNLPPGRYRLTGHVTAALAPDGTKPIPVAVTLIRMSQDRFDYLRSSVRAGAVDSTFEIGERSALEEIELSCDVNTTGSDVWLDPSSLRIAKAP
jgi:hypothetical protein